MVTNILHISGIDIIDGTPLLDIKPYIGKFDIFLNTKNGWLGNAGAQCGVYADDRFTNK